MHRSLRLSTSLSIDRSVDEAINGAIRMRALNAKYSHDLNARHGKSCLERLSRFKVVVTVHLRAILGELTPTAVAHQKINSINLIF
jgi:hypothetical protein